MLPPPPGSWRAPEVKKTVVKEAAKFLHMRGYNNVNLAEVDEAVRLALDQGDCDPFAAGIPGLGDLFTTKQQIFVSFLEGLLNETVDEAIETVSRQFAQKALVDPVGVVLHGGVDLVLTTFQSFRFLLAGAVAEGFSLRRIDPFLFSESRRVAHIFFAGLLGFWRLPDEHPDDEAATDWHDRTYKVEQIAAVTAIRGALDTPLDQQVMVDGLYLLYGGATIWFLMNRSIDPTVPRQVLDDLTVLAAGAIRQLGADDSYLRRALRIEKRVRSVNLSDPLRRLIPKRQLEGLGARLLSIAYGELPRRILLANGLR